MEGFIENIKTSTAKSNTALNALREENKALKVNIKRYKEML